jgi:hypothetical protein
MTNTFYENSQYSDAPYGLKLRQTIYETKATYQIINAVAAGQYITYTCVNFYKPGQTVTITGCVSNNNLSATANTGFNINNATILSVTNVSFTVASTLAITETYTSGGSVTSGSILIPSNIKRVYAVCIGGGGSGGATMPSVSLPIISAIGNGTTLYINVNNSLANLQSFALVGMTTVTGATIGVTGLPINLRTNTFVATGYNTPGTATGGTLVTGGGAGGGGAGGISWGWSFVSNTAQIGRGGESIASTFAFNAANAGGTTVYGQIMAGGGLGGVSGTNANTGTAILGGAGGGGGPAGSGTAGAVSFTGAPGGSGNGGFGFAAGGGVSGNNGITAGIGSGGGAVNNVSTNAGITNGGSGIIGGGAGSVCTTGVVTSGTGLGGNSDFYSGGSGSTGTGILFGGGGGGAGYLGAGENAINNAGGAGGIGGGGGGASSNGAFSGKGGDGVIFLYY